MIPGSGYSVILADPAWKFSDKSLHRGGAERHYRTMTVKEIIRLNVREIAADDSLLFLWVPYPFVVRNVHTYVAECWGFTLKTVAFTWVKTTGNSNRKSGMDGGAGFVKPGFAWGMGHWTRSNPECCFLGVRGHPKRVGKGVHSVVMAPRGRHSAKPPEVRDRIVELAGDVRRIELFARGPKPEGWDTWGLEAE